MFQIRVPASTANLGCGFDSLGIGFQLYNTFIFRSASSYKIGNSFAPRHRNDRNMVLRSLKTSLKKINKTIEGVQIDIEENIPVSRGLGSSATCIIAGVLAAYVLSDTPVDTQQVFNLCSDLEGHADNVSAAMFGGLTVSYRTKDGWRYLKQMPDEKYSFCVFVPNFPLATSKARKVLPPHLSYQDGIHNIARATLMVAALTQGRSSMLADAADDRLHQPYRIPLIAEYRKIESFAKSAGAHAVFISGAGPSIMVIIDRNDMTKMFEAFQKVKGEFQYDWQAISLEVENEGVRLIKE